MSAAGSRTWLAIEKPDQTLENILKGLRKFADIDLAERPRLSLEWANNAVWLRSTNPEALFLRLFRDRPVPVRALSLAPYSDLCRLYNKTFQHQGSRYRIRRCRETDFPYYRRFLDLEYLEAGVQLDTDEAEVRIDKVPPKDVNSGALLWLDPQRIDLEDDEVVYLFDFGRGKARLGADMTGALFLPPVRTAAHPDLWPTHRSENERDVEAGSYFSTDLRGLRAAHLKRATAGRELSSEPAAVTMSRLVDEPLVRDLLLDGSRICVNSTEGRPTTISLEIASRDIPGALYRGSAILDPEGVEGPAWGRDLMRAIRDDVFGLVESGWQIGPVQPPPGSPPLPRWRLQQLRSYRPGGYDGTWPRIQKLSEALDVAADLRNCFEHRILLSTRERSVNTPSPPDNDLAEMLLLHDLWRAPWSDDIEEPSWRRAMLELLRDTFSTCGMRPEDRVASWNRSTDGDGIHFVHSRDGNGALLLHYSGSPNDARVLMWRLLLPLGTIINARTLYLDRAGRSQLNAGYMLA